MKILAVADEESKYLWEYYEPSKLRDIDLIIGCGDLSRHYMNFCPMQRRFRCFMYTATMMPAMIENRPAVRSALTMTCTGTRATALWALAVAAVTAPVPGSLPKRK